MSIRFNSIGSVSIKKNSTNDLQNANVTENNITISASVSEIYEGDILTFTITRDSSIINTSQNFKLICSNDSTITSYDIQKLNILNSESSNISDDGYEFLFDISEQTKTIDIPINLDVNTNPKETDKAFKLSIYEGSSLLVTSELITIKNTVAISSVNPPISGTAESGTMLKFYKNTQTPENLFFQLDYADNTNGIWQINPSDYRINLGSYSNDNTNDGLISILGTASDIAGNESQPGILKVYLDTQEQVDESSRQLKDDGGYGPFVFEFQGVSGGELQYPKFITTTQPSIKIKNASWGSANYSKESHGLGLYILYKNDYQSNGHPSPTTDEVISNILNYTDNDTPYELQFNFAAQKLSTNMKQNIYFRVEDVAGNYELFEGHGEDPDNLGTSDGSIDITVTVLSSAVLTPSTTKLLKGEGLTLTFDIPELVPQLPQFTAFLAVFLSDDHEHDEIFLDANFANGSKILTPEINSTSLSLPYYQTKTAIENDREFRIGINSHRASGTTNGCGGSEYQLAETVPITVYYAELSISQISVAEGGSFTVTITSNIPDDDSKYYYIKERFTNVTDINSSTGLSIRKYNNETVTITTLSGSGDTSLDIGLYSSATHFGTDYENLITASVINIIHNYTVTANVTTINQGESVTFTITTTDDTVTTIYAYLNSSSTMTNSDFDEDISYEMPIAVSITSGSGTLTLNASSNTTVQDAKTFSIDFTENNYYEDTNIVKRVNATDSGTSDISDLVEFTYNNDVYLYFFADDGINGKELWRSSGTVNGTTMAYNINQTSDSSNPDFLTVFRGNLYFIADGSDSNGKELWRSDGGGDTFMLKNINSDSTDSNISNLLVVGNYIYFTANDSIHGNELWKSDGSEYGTVMVKNINSSGDSNISNLVGMNDILYFVADDGVNGSELWKSDGTEEGTTIVKNINNIINDVSVGDSEILNLTAIDNTLYFAAWDGSYMTGDFRSGRELWKSDGTEAGTELIKVINDKYNGGSNSDPNYFTKFGDYVYFSANNHTNKSELWRTDGTEAGTTMVKELSTSVNSGSADPKDFVVYKNLLYFTAYSDDYSLELWKTDGTYTGTELVKDINSTATGNSWTQSSEISGLFLYDKYIYFSATDGVDGIELWRSDGTESGTELVEDIQDASYNSSNSSPQNFTIANNILFFTAEKYQGNRVDRNLWKHVISKGTNLATSETITVQYLEQTAIPGNLSLDASYDSGTLNDNITSFTTIKLNGTVSNNNEHSIELYVKEPGEITYTLYSTTTLTPTSLGYELDVILSSTDGIYKFKVKATENLKSKSEFSNEYSLTLDTAAPNITIDAGENTYTLNYFTNTIDITSVGSGSYDVVYNTGTPSIADNLVSILQNVDTFSTKTTVKWAIEIKENLLIKIDDQYYKFSSVSLDSSKITFSTLPDLTISTSQKDLTFICIAPERNVN